MNKELEILNEFGVYYTHENPKDDPTFQFFSYESYHNGKSCGNSTIYVHCDDKSARENFLTLINGWNRRGVIGNAYHKWLYIAN